MRFQNVYVIKDGAGNYISPRGNEEDSWFFVAYTGRNVTGFTFYSNKETATREMAILNGLGNDFHLDLVEFKSIPKGCRNDG